MAAWDAVLHWTIRGLALACLFLFVYALLTLNFPAFIGALEAGILAYILLRVDVERHPADARTHDVRVDDKEEPPTEADTKAVYTLQVAGIPLSFEMRHRRGREKEGVWRAPP